MPLMDPMFNFEYMSLPLVQPEMGAPPMKEMRFSLSQTIPFPGKLSAAREVRERSLDVSRWNYEVMAGRMKRDVSIMYYQIASMDRMIALDTRKIDQLEALLQTVDVAYRTGKATYSDYTKMKIMISMAKNERQKTSLEREAMLNALRRMAGYEDFPVGITFTFPSLPGDPSASKENLLNRARLNFPGIGYEGALAKKARGQTDAARWEAAPDFALGASLNLPEEGGVYFSFMVGVTIPLLFMKQLPEINMAENMEQAAQKTYQNQLNVLAENIITTIDLIKGNLEILSQFDDQVIPEAEGSIDISLQAYRTARMDLRTLLEQMTLLFEYSIDREMIALETVKLFINLEFYTGWPPVSGGDR